MNSVGILIPLMRPHLFHRLLESIEAATPEPHQVYIVSTQETLDEIPASEYRDLPQYFSDEGGTFAGRCNRLYEESSEAYVFCGADDIVFHEGWFRAALRTQKKVDGVVMVNDLCSVRGTLPLISRNYLETLGGTVDGAGPIFNEYWHCFAETELIEVAETRKRYAYCEASVVEHHHWMAGKAERSDPVYVLGEEHWDEDVTTFSERRKLWQ